MQSEILSALKQAQSALDNFVGNEAALTAIEDAAGLLVEAFKNGGAVYSCGNGGSMCDAMHFAEELSGKFRKERTPLPAAAISDAAHLSCAANDFGYDEVFSRFTEAHIRAGDCLLGISTSGKSPNVIKAAISTRAKGGKVIALTGRKDCPLAEHADVIIAAEGGTAYSDRVQELHIKVIHILIELVERALYPDQSY